MNKELFIEIIEDIKKVYYFQENMNSFFRENGADGYIFTPDCTGSVLKLLHSIFSDTDKDEWISYFCFELEFGTKWKPGTITENGKDIRLGTIDDLYNLLCPETEGEEKSANMD